MARVVVFVFVLAVVVCTDMFSRERLPQSRVELVWLRQLHAVDLHVLEVGQVGARSQLADHANHSGGFACRENNKQ